MLRLTAILLPLLLGPAVPQEPASIDFAILSDFDYEPGSKLPVTVTRYHKKTVSIIGFMEREIPGSGPVEFFMLINDACGCTGMPKLNEVIFAAMPEDEPTDILPGLVTLTGTLYVEEQREDDEVVAIYVMDVDKITSPQ